MTRVVLARNQQVTLNGSVLEGTRDVDIEASTRTHDVTSWEHSGTSTLVTGADFTVKFLIYWQENFRSLVANFNSQPPVPMDLSIGGAGSVKVVPTNIAIKQPIGGVVAWEVTCRTFLYN